jgi:hypothetical protein
MVNSSLAARKPLKSRSVKLKRRQDAPDARHSKKLMLMNMRTRFG